MFRKLYYYKEIFACVPVSATAKINTVSKSD